MNKNEIEDSYWNSEFFIPDAHINHVERKSLKNIRNKFNDIIKKNFPPKIVISQDKVNKLNNIIESYIKDKIFIKTFKEELKEITM